VAIDTDGKRLLGRYITYIEAGPDGRFHVVEQIMLYLLPFEESKLLERVATHEYVHAIWQRRQLEPEFRLAHPDSEEFVCSLGLCED
jgi:hypothetical protein